MSPSVASQPVVIFGGFLSYPSIYDELRDTLARLTGQPVWVVPAQSLEWLGNIAPWGWAHLLGKLERTVQQAARSAPGGKVTIVGHSMGGVMARVFLDPKPFRGHTYRGADYVNRLITLGSPHHLRRELLRRWRAEAQYPGTFFAPQVAYTTVAGRRIRGDYTGSTQARTAYRFYRQLGGDGNVWGDGLVPVDSALLVGTRQIILDGVSHYHVFGRRWYGSPEVVAKWWETGTA